METGVSIIIGHFEDQIGSLTSMNSAVTGLPHRVREGKLPQHKERAPWKLMFSRRLV